MRIRPLTKTYCFRLPSPVLLVITGVVFLSLSVTLFISLPYILSPVRNCKGDYLIIEGWLPDYALEHAVKIFYDGNYRQILVTGCELQAGSFLSEYSTYATLGASSLKIIGVPESCIVALPLTDIVRNRTWQSALSVKKWLENNSYHSGAIDVCSLGPHGRRTWHFYKKALGHSIKTGIFSLNVQEYTSKNWFLCSEGFRQVTYELIALIYALFFSP